MAPPQRRAEPRVSVKSVFVGTVACTLLCLLWSHFWHVTAFGAGYKHLGHAVSGVITGYDVVCVLLRSVVMNVAFAFVLGAAHELRHCVVPAFAVYHWTFAVLAIVGSLLSWVG